MKQHSFRKGDLVVCKGYGWRGVFQEIAKKHGDAHFLGGNIPCVCNISELQHDRDFQVGDWVRYKGICSTNTPKLNGRIGKIERIENGAIAYVPDFCPLASGSVFLENLVKIAPPTEEIQLTGTQKMANKMIDSQYDPQPVTIEHDQWGRVDGVGRNMEPCQPLNVMWEKDGACYTEFHGWREVKPKRWVPVKIELGRTNGRTLAAYVNNQESYPHHFNLPPSYRWKTVEIEREVEG